MTDATFSAAWDMEFRKARHFSRSLVLWAPTEFPAGRRPLFCRSRAVELMPTTQAQFLKDELAKYGIPWGVVRTFDHAASPELIDYLDLVETRRAPAQISDMRPDGVAELQGRPLLFFVNESKLSTDPLIQDRQLSNLSRGLACRGDEVFLARIRPGELLVEKVSLRRRQSDWRPYTAGSEPAITFFSRIAHGVSTTGPEEMEERSSIFQEMLTLLTNSADRLRKRLSRADVLSLMGRALFFRFLIDRAIVGPADISRICRTAKNLKNCFDDARSAQQTCAWLDKTFNGNFLPFTTPANACFKFLEDEFPSACSHLAAIVQGWEPSGASYQMKLGWGDFDFAHVPVGLLSQVYEAFCWKWEHENARLTSVHYTPRHIAATVVDEAFEDLPDASGARVLDCACGAAVFLVLAFRRLYRERWLVTGHRPDTKAIRQILENQLTGFDVSEAALKLAALSLYLTAIELDPTPIPPEKLRFKDLMGTVLFNHRLPDDPPEGPVLGSLGPHVDREFDGKFHLVLSNPPWTSLPGGFSEPLTRICRDVFRRSRKYSALAECYVNPDVEPDLPFILRATEWCRQGGRIAMALPARILLKQSDVPRQARRALFELLQVSGIINGSNLSDTAVWPGMSQPFMLLFATNQPSLRDHVVRFISPQFDERVRRDGQLIIDSKSAHPLRVADADVHPWLWKSHAIGTVLDVEVVRRVCEAGTITLAEYWRKLNLHCGKGFQIAPLQVQKSAPFMGDYPELIDASIFGYVVDTTRLGKSARKGAWRPRDENIYKGPLVIVRQSPGDPGSGPRALFSDNDVLYPEKFFGYSTAGHPHGELLARYLHLFIHSSIWMHYALATSPEFGAERRRIHKEDLDACPFIAIDERLPELRQNVLEMSELLASNDPAAIGLIDEFFAELYGLDELDLEVIRDTLDVSLPYSTSRQRAWAEPTFEEKSQFCRRVQAVLSPFFKGVRKRVKVTSINLVRGSSAELAAPFTAVLVADADRPPPIMDAQIQKLILRLGEETGASRVVQVHEGSLLLFVLNQYRYWTPSRARLLATEIVRRHFHVFEG